MPYRVDHYNMHGEEMPQVKNIRYDVDKEQVTHWHVFNGVLGAVR